MSRRRRTFCMLAFAVLFLVGSRADGQRLGPINSRLAAQVGLETAWSTVIPVDFGGRITGATIHISSDEGYQTTVITDKFGRKSYFSERALTDRGATLGLDQSLRQAELREAILKRRGLDPIVETVETPEITVYLRSSMGTLTAIDAETGRPKWTKQAGKNGYPNYVAAATDDLVATISGTKLYVLSAANGEILQTRSLMNAPGAGPAFARGFIYVPTIRGLVEVYESSNIEQIAFTLSSPGRIRQPVSVGPRSISWTTDRGDVYVATPGDPGIIYEFQALGPIADAPVQLGTSMYATSIDGFVYSFNDKDGTVNWRYSSGEPIRSSPLPVEDALFLITDQGKLVCLDATSGEDRWLASGVDRFLAVSETRLYCVTDANTLVAFDRTTGGRVGEALLNSLALPMVNTQTDRIYLAGMDGTFQCLREIGHRLPLTRFVPTEPEEPKSGEPATESPLAGTGASETPKAAEAPAATAADGPTADDNPFAIGIDAGGDAGAEGAAGPDFSFDDLGDGDAAAPSDAGEDNPFAPF